MEGFEIDTGPHEWGWISGCSRGYLKATVAQAKHKWDAKSMVITSDTKQMRVQVILLLNA